MLLLDTNVILRIGFDDGASPPDGKISPSSVALVEDAARRGRAGISVSFEIHV